MDILYKRKRPHKGHGFKSQGYSLYTNEKYYSISLVEQKHIHSTHINRFTMVSETIPLNLVLQRDHVEVKHKGTINKMLKAVALFRLTGLIQHEGWL